MPSFAEKPQGPFNAFFPKGENAAFGVHQIRMIGSGIPGVATPATPTGPATGINSGGVQSVSATLLATGIYDVRFPPTKSVDVNAQVYSSSGYRFECMINNLYGPSGSCQLEISRLVPTGGAAQPSGQGYIPTGSVVALTFFAAPNSDGLVGY